MNMNIFWFSALQSYSLVIAVVIGLVRFHQLDKSYRPFIILCCLGIVNEIISTALIWSHHSNAWNNNLYILAESLLYVRLFYNWGEFKDSGQGYLALIFFLVAVWITDNLITGSIFQFSSYFRIIYSFTLIFLSINEINRLLFSNRHSLLKNARFLICMGIVIFYTYKAIVETFYLFQLNFSNSFYNSVHLILEVVNLVVNFIFAFAVLCIPRRQNFILPFS
jgi:hypothetical protein